MRKKCSIITVNLNNKDGLQQTIQSVIAQTGDEIEYLVIDGASTDGSVDIIKQYRDNIDQWISEPDTGVYNAMNKGIDRASGEYLLFLNSGDRLYQPNVIEKVLPELKQDLVYGDMILDHGSHEEPITYADKLTMSYLFDWYIPHPASFIRKTLFEKVGKYEEQYPVCADWAFAMRALCLHGASYRHIKQTITRFDMHGMSAKPENFPAIRQERDGFLNTHFSLYLDDFAELKKLRRIPNSRTFRFFRRLGFFKRKGV